MPLPGFSFCCAQSNLAQEDYDVDGIIYDEEKYDEYDVLKIVFVKSLVIAIINLEISLIFIKSFFSLL